MIGNSINHQDNRLDELNHRGMSLQDDDTASIKSYGSHKNRPFKDESHKGSAETMDGEEKRDVSKEDLGIDEGKTIREKNLLVTQQCLTYQSLFRIGR